jgi:hypothetical protein
VPWTTAVAWAADSSPATRAVAVWGRGPRNRARAVWTVRWAAAALRRSRVRSQLAVEGARLAVVDPGGPAAVQSGQPPQPLAVQGVVLVLEPGQVLAEGGVGQLVQVLDGQGLERDRQPIGRPLGQPRLAPIRRVGREAAEPPGRQRSGQIGHEVVRWALRPPLGRRDRICVRVHSGNLSGQPPNTSTNRKLWRSFSPQWPASFTREGCA